MINQFNITPVEINRTYLCEINQYKALESVSKFPKIAFYFVALAFLFMFIYYYVIPYIKNEQLNLTLSNLFGKAPFIFVASGLYFMLYTTFNITEQIEKTIIIPVAVVLFILFLIPVVIKIKNELSKNNKNNDNN